MKPHTTFFIILDYQSPLQSTPLPSIFLSALVNFLTYRSVNVSIVPSVQCLARIISSSIPFFFFFFFFSFSFSFFFFSRHSKSGRKIFFTVSSAPIYLSASSVQDITDTAPFLFSPSIPLLDIISPHIYLHIHLSIFPSVCPSIRPSVQRSLHHPQKEKKRKHTQNKLAKRQRLIKLTNTQINK